MSEDWLPKLKKNFPLASLTTMGVGGPADYFAEINSESELQSLFETAKKNSLPVTVIGCGSNLIIGDKGIRGIVIRLTGDFAKLAESGGKITAGSGVMLPKLVTYAAERGFGGMESLVGVPGAVGGSIVMNAGTREGEVSRYLSSVRFFDPTKAGCIDLAKEKIRFAYRESQFQKMNVVVLSGTFEFPVAKSKEEVLNRIEGFVRRRRETQPLNTKNSGSMFTNPKGDYAARLIEAAGLKGMQVGKAQVSTLHANFITNLGGASASDIKSLMSLIQESVHKKSGIHLEPEVRFMGEF